MIEKTCVESADLTYKFPIIAGAEWEFTDNWNCLGNFLGYQTVLAWDGSQTAINSRMNCARKCLESKSCVAFHYPGKPQPDGTSRCHWKYGLQKSSKLNKTCGGAYQYQQYYTLLEKNHACKEGTN